MRKIVLIWPNAKWLPGIGDGVIKSLLQGLEDAQIDEPDVVELGGDADAWDAGRRVLSGSGE